MEVALIIGLALLATALGLLLLRERQGSARDEAPSVDLAVPSTSDATSITTSATQDVAPEPVSYRVTDPAAPDRELLVEFVPSDLAQLAEAKEVDRVSDSHTGANAFDALVDSLPKAAAMIESGMIMRVVGPPDALAGLQSGAYELVTSGGRNLGQVRDVASGHFGSHLEVSSGVTPAMGALAVFQVMSVVTGQYYLHRIDSKLNKIANGINALVQGQQSELLGKIRAAGRINEQVRRDLMDGIPPNEGDREDLGRAEQLVLSAYGEAQSRVSDLLVEFEGFEVAEASKKGLRDCWERVSGQGLTDINLLLYAAFIRHQNNLLSQAVDPQGDARRAENIHERMEEEREAMLADLGNVQPLLEELCSMEEEDFDYFFVGRAKLKQEADEFRQRTEGIRAIVSDPGKRALPPPPPLEVPFMAEIFRDGSGERKAVGAVLRQS